MQNLNRNDRLAALRIVAIYAFFSGLWIYLSDTILGRLFQDPAAIVHYSVLKALLFIAVTVWLLYQLIARHARESRQAAEALKKMNEELELRVAERTQELERRNEELQRTYRSLEEETIRRIGAMQELRQRDQMMMQQSRMAAMGEMLSNLAHHWRQPLNVLGLRVQEIALCYQPAGCSKALIDSNIAKAMETLRQMSRTIDDFMEFSAPDSEEARLFRVAEAINSTLSLVEANFREQGIAVEVEIADDPQINGYLNAYRQVLLEILINARDAFGDHPAAARIRVRAETERGKAVVTISDNAGGVKEEAAGRIFDPYFTTKEVGKGSGTGLFIAKTLIEKRMHGRLAVRNLEDGAEFRIEV